jgi:protein-tyrosine phosphatase
LLNDSELRHLGVNVKDYKLACEKQGVTFYQYPIIEMAPPEDLGSFKSDVVDVIIQHIKTDPGNALVHCRGGVGRAGLVTCCVLATLC